MTTSESIKNIGAALLLFHEKVGTIKKDAKNPFFKSEYASLPAIQEGIHEALQASELVVIQSPGTHSVTTRIVDTKSGEWIEGVIEMTPAKNDPQGEGSLITYAKRYALTGMLNLAIDDDDDGNAASTPAAPATPKMGVGIHEDFEQIQKGNGISTEAHYPKQGMCPNCNVVLVEKNGKFGPFHACPNYPKCKYILKDKPNGRRESLEEEAPFGNTLEDYKFGVNE